MSSSERYRSTYGTTTGSYVEQGSAEDAVEARLAARQADWKRSRVRDQRLIVGACVVVVSFAFALWSVFGPLPGWLAR